MGHIHRVETNQGGPQTNISLRQLITGQEAVLAEDLLQTFQRGKYPIDRFVIGLLAGGESGFIDPVVDVVIDPAVQLINLRAQRRRVVISCAGAQSVKGGIQHADDFRRLIADNGLLLLVPQYRHRNAPAVVRIGMQIELIEKFVLVEGIARGCREAIVESPAVFKHQGVDHGDGNKRLKPFQAAQNQGAMRPWTGKRNVQMVTVFFRSESGLAAWARRAIGG